MDANSPRHLVLRQTLKAIQAVQDVNSNPDQEPNPFPELLTGEEQIFSFYEPNLKGGRYTIKTEQTITAPNEPSSKTDHAVDYPTDGTSQHFDVKAPKFNLPSDAVHSLYPPQGYAATAETLPHIVFNDPHLPWTREGSSRWDDGRGKTPWLALLVFTQEELTIAHDQLDPMFASTASVHKSVHQDATGTIEIKMSELHQVANVTTPNNDASDDHVHSVFLGRELFTELVRKYDKGKPVDQQDAADVSRYKFLAHIRNINTMGMAEAGTQDLGLFSVIVSHRVGPLNIHKPTPVIVHLLSLEDVEKMPWPIASDKQYVALPSLYSWTYTTLPEGSFNIFTAMEHLGDNLGMLQVETQVLDALAGSHQSDRNLRLIERLRDGYTLVRHRVQTGEVTSAVIRGALTPKIVDHSNDHKLKPQSNTGTDLQIFDDKLGLMDITYSTAWQLGKTLALADQGFCASLARLRIVVQNFAMSTAKVQHQEALNAYLDLESTLQALPESIAAIDTIQRSLPGREPAGMLDRWKRTKVRPSDLSLGNPFIVDKFEDSTAPIMKILASSVSQQPSADIAVPRTQSDGPEGAGEPHDNPLYNELNKPYSTDWQIVLAWIIDRMYLVNIPAQYLIVDPSYLPKESLRFFHIDQNWLDALIDGALSIGNTLEEHTDTIRMRLKEAVNRYLTTEIPKINRTPQVPIYGMLMRSDVVSQFPDLRVSAPRLHGEQGNPATAPAATLRHENIDNGVMLCLFDRLPAEDGLFTLLFTQPPHQQTFVAAKVLDSDRITVSFKRMYTSATAKPDRSKLLGEDLKLTNDEAAGPPASNPPPDPVFAWGKEQQIRTLIVPSYIQAVSKRLHDAMPREECSEDGTVPTSAMLAIQLNNPIYELNIDFKPVKKDLRVLETRTLRMMEPWAAKNLMSASLSEDVTANAFVGLPPPENRTTSGPLQAVPPSYRIARQMRESDAAELHAQMQNVESETVASMPQFKYTVYPITMGPTKDKNVKSIPTLVDVKQDLVFSIILQNSAAEGTFDLEEIRIVIPMGEPNDKRQNYTLFESYNGPGPAMLSNLRFNAMHEFTYKKLVIRLLPRSLPKKIKSGGVERLARSVSWKKAAEVSFILRLVNVYPYKTPTTVRMTAMEKYSQYKAPTSYPIKAELTGTG